MKLEKETRKAIIQIPKEISKLNQIMALTAKTLLNAKINELKENRKLRENKGTERRGVS